MSVIISDLKCPNCGADISLKMKECEYCGSSVIINTVGNSSVTADVQKTQDMSAAYNFLKLKLYDKALEIYESVMQKDFNNSDAYFYAAVALLKGKRPFLVSASAIKKAEEYLQTAIAVEPKGIYYYFWSYIRLDHHFRKFYKMSPGYNELYCQAQEAGLSSADIRELFSILGVEKPSEI